MSTADDTPADQTTADQRAYWNAEAGITWAAESAALDAMLDPLGALAMTRLEPLAAGARVVDIGCGAGATSRALAARGAEVVGVDVSEPLLALARAKGGGPDYVLADAGADPLPGPFDAAFSRFGVMFFADPTAAFAHLRAHMRAQAPLAFVCWGPMAENEWATAPLAAALPHLDTPPTPPAGDVPGPFAFAREGYAASLLAAAGWRDVAVNAWRGPHQIGASPTAAAALMLRVGPLARMLRDQPGAVPAVTDALVNLFKRQTDQTVIQYLASLWIVTARA